MVPYDSSIYIPFKVIYMKNLQKIPVLLGPTASGKTRVVASHGALNVEVVSADSRQIYRCMDIGTAKPTDEERKSVPHHLIDIIDPGDTYSAGLFRTDAEAAIADCLDRDTIPVVVGGTGFYVQTLTHGLSPIPPIPAHITEELRCEIEESGPNVLYRKLREIDSDAANGIEPNDLQRIVRALSVYEHTGRKLSDWWKESPPPPRYQYRLIGVERPRAELRERIRLRVNEMLRAGLEDEVRGLVDSGLGWDTTAMKTLGYREWRPYFDGEASRDDVRETICTHTAQYAKRQMTWFRRITEIEWISADAPETLSYFRRVIESAKPS
jgi:tRNA dimethylallyltransferase